MKKKIVCTIVFIALATLLYKNSLRSMENNEKKSSNLSLIHRMIEQIPTTSNIDNLVIEHCAKLSDEEIITHAQTSISRSVDTLTDALLRLYIFKQFQKNLNVTAQEINAQIQDNTLTTKINALYQEVQKSAGVAALSVNIIEGTLDLSGMKTHPNPRIANLYGLGLIPNKESIITLALGFNKLQNLQPGAFQGLINLKKLCLMGNKLAELKQGLFQGLTNLQELWLTFNKLAELKQGLFQGLTNLKKLNLSVNKLHNFEPGAFQGLTNLQELWLRENKLTELKQGLFQGLTNLKKLNLNANQLHNFEPGAFQGLTNLQELWLRANKLTELKQGLFQGLTNLQMLFLQNNQLTNLSREVFQDLRNLKTLDLSDNQLTNLNPEIFQDMKDLQDLQIGGNPAQPNVGILKGIIKTKID